MVDHHQLQVAARDARLRGLDMRVLVALQAWLGHDAARRVKVSTIANDLYLDPARPTRATQAQRTGVARSIGRLEGFGYLRRGPMDGQLKTYTLATPLRTSCNTGATSRIA